MPQKAKAKPQAQPAPKPAPEPTTVAGLSVADFESAMQAEKLAFALFATMIGNAGKCPARLCRQHGRCMNAAATGLCSVPMPDWVDDLAYAARHFLRRFVEEGR
ncbi:MAG: hypothetical protein KF849_02970 [Rhizobiaceae bacterium]|nr:hypothetical protein [Rhizobiaceae bacterium]